VLIILVKRYKSVASRSKYSHYSSAAYARTINRGGKLTRMDIPALRARTFR